MQFSRVKQLLAETDFTLQHIAERQALNIRSSLSVAFKKTFNLTPVATGNSSADNAGSVFPARKARRGQSRMVVNACAGNVNVGRPDPSPCFHSETAGRTEVGCSAVLRASNEAASVCTWATDRRGLNPEIFRLAVTG